MSLRAQCRRLWFSLLCAVVMLVAGTVAPAQLISDSASTVAIRAGRVMPVSENLDWVIDDGVVLIMDGVVRAVGRYGEVSIPRGVPVVHWPDSTVVPGFVAASSGVISARRGDESIAADYRAADGFDLYRDYRALLAGGVTTVHLSPGWHRLVSGQGAVVRLAGRQDERILSYLSDLTVTLGPGVFNPPDLSAEMTTPTPSHAIEPTVRQRPNSRLGQYVALRDAIAAAVEHGPMSTLEMPLSHRRALARAWQNGQPVRVQAHDVVDIDLALRFFSEYGRTGYVVGGWGAADAASALRESGTPLVYTVGESLRGPASNLGTNPDVLHPDVRGLAELGGVRLALSVAGSNSIVQLRLAASLAMRAGLSEQQVLEAITRVPAEIMGVDDRVGSIAVGKDADLVVLTGAPLETTTHVQRVLVRGRVVYKAASSRATVVRAETIWLGPDNWLSNGAILIEDGRITQVGQRVAVPPTARVVDGGPGSFVAPGFIDSHSHLTLGGDGGALAPNLSIASLIGAADIDDQRVALAGVTTVLAAPYRFHGRGSQVTAVKTAGRSRDERVVRPTAAVAFDVRGQDPRNIGGRLKPPLEAGKKYLQKWQKYEADLAQWEKKKAEGTIDESAKATTEDVVTDQPEDDPITGTWSLRATGAMLPEPVEGAVSLKLTGNQIEGRMTEPPEATEVDHRILGTLDGTHIVGTVEIDAPIDLPAEPFWEGDIKEPDHIVAVAGLRGMVQVDVELNRTDRKATDFKVVRRKRKTTGEGGRPLPPPIDEALEPVRALLEKKIPALVSVETPAEIEAALNVLIDQYELRVVLLNAQGARVAWDRLKEEEVGVVLPTQVVRTEKWSEYHEGDDLSRRGVAVAFQSGAEDGARSLRDVALYAVERGMSPELVLEAMTSGAAGMFDLDDRVGSIAPGRDGDLVIFSGYPFDPATTIRRVLVNGEDVEP